MNNKEIINAIEELSPEGKKILREFLEFLKLKYSKNIKKQKVSLKESRFIGMWKDREDMRNTEEYINNLREKEWRN